MGHQPPKQGLGDVHVGVPTTREAETGICSSRRGRRPSGAKQQQWGSSRGLKTLECGGAQVGLVGGRLGGINGLGVLWLGGSRSVKEGRGISWSV
jgi:hypothetical protein